MKRKQLKALKLNKKSISNFNNLNGGRPPKSFYYSECDCDVQEVSISCFIESNCIGCTVTTHDTYNDC